MLLFFKNSATELRAKECGKALEAEKDEKRDSTPKSPEEHSPADT